PNRLQYPPATPDCQRLVFDKSRQGRRVISLTNGGLFQPDHRDASERTRLNGSVATVPDITFSRFALVRFGQQPSRTPPALLARSSFAFQRWPEKQYPNGCRRSASW